ncbi:MAG: disulfide bond formation protein B [Pseudomonadota bacterium]
MTRNRAIALAAGGSMAMLLAAWGFEYIGGLAPCKLCYWQRWPHIAAVVIGIVALGAGLRWLALLGATAAATTAGVGLYHTGVERGWWPGPSSCSGGGGMGDMTGAELLSTEGVGSVVMCDQVAWSLFGLSMASWNMLVSLLFVGLWIYAALRRETQVQNVPA